MAITGVSNYSSVYENTYVSSRKEAAKKEETKETAATQKGTETAKSGDNEEYLKSLQKQFPNMKLQVGYGVNTKNDGKVDVLNISPKLLEKMQNDPNAAKEYTQRLKDVEAAHKYVDSFFAATGRRRHCRCTVRPERDAFRLWYQRSCHSSSNCRALLRYNLFV